MSDLSEHKVRPRSSSRQGSGGIRAVAREAGVSTATVSRVFNRPESVTAETRSKVMETADRLFYVPDNAARALSSQRSLRIGALIPTIDDSIFAQFVTALQRELGKSGYALILGIDEFDAELEFKEIRSLIESGVDAVVLCGANRKAVVYDLLQARRIPYLLTNVYQPSGPHPCVGYDNHEGAGSATRYLLEQGHRHFGIIDFPVESNDRAALRVAGISAALAERGLELNSKARVHRAYSFEDGRIGLRTLLDNAPETTAIQCGNDVLAIGALFEAQALGLKVPEQLSIVGFDDLDLASQITPKLTTVKVPTDIMGRRTAETLLLTLSGEPAPHATRIDTNLVIRGTTGPAPA